MTPSVCLSVCLSVQSPYLRKGARKAYRERKCADAIGTVPVPWAGMPFPMLKYKTFLKYNTRKQFYQTALGNSHGLKLQGFRL